MNHIEICEAWRQSVIDRTIALLSETKTKAEIRDHMRKLKKDLWQVGASTHNALQWKRYTVDKRIAMEELAAFDRALQSEIDVRKSAPKPGETGTEDLIAQAIAIALKM